MIDLMRKFFYLGLGTAVFTKEKADQIIDELVKGGHMEKGEASRLVNELIEKGQQQEELMRETVRGEISRWRSEVGLATRRELKELEQRVKALEDLLKLQEEEKSSSSPEESTPQ